MIDCEQSMFKKIKYLSPNFEPRPSGVLPDMIILHYTDLMSTEEALTRLCDVEAKVSSHFLISKEGVLYQLVDPIHRAWHAGISFWQGERDINSRSIGIELDNYGHQFGPEPFPSLQIDTLLNLLNELTKKYKIPAHRILGHSDVAPLRKKDPGESFPWKVLAAEGFGIWPEHVNSSSFDSMSILEVQQALSKIGYDCPQTNIWEEESVLVMTAFQRHFVQSNLSGYPDEITCNVLQRALAVVNENS